MSALDRYSPQCDPDQAISCRLTWKLTHNQTAADVAEWVLGRPTAILVLILIGLMVRWLIHRTIDRTVRHAEEGPVRMGRIPLGGNATLGSALRRGDSKSHSRRVQRVRTMGSLLKSITTGIVFTIVAMMSIGQLGYDIGPLLASAGILGVALGFGAQALVRDFLSGIFMIFEDQYGVGDQVDVGEASGAVEAVGLRVTRLRDVNGTVWYVRNGEILRVGNMSQNWARTVLDVAVAYHEDLARVRQVLGEVAHDLWEDDEFKGLIIEPPEVWGVQDIGPEGVHVRVALKTAPLEQWGIGRELRQRIKARFDYEGIEVPYPEWVVKASGWQDAPGPSTLPADHGDVPG
ncbi:mechanosensitive ion channel family protein [Nocardioides sp. JQ2195]|uniref:mechanosensitive ion channel family protein n=1 Tax=Nocardioides sp. JQ2195 TaxID=2592334 RepID=UPI00143EA768|nr:mechanosensitive ion channel family protein [Nocardioides sp. JQ2195]QIX26052.1 mechanosensitive ion channel family protein [Nocardioides sp. JQ2195]